MTQATEIAQQTSAELLAAAERQSVEIQDAGRSVLAMASSMTRGVREREPVGAGGAPIAGGCWQRVRSAVRIPIKGMNEMREQIQETSKRIKRLGESSQEIGEIVELISDITEQTNVLASMLPSRRLRLAMPVLALLLVPRKCSGWPNGQAKQPSRSRPS